MDNPIGAVADSPLELVPGGRLFITWSTSIAKDVRLDHAVTDEAFAESPGTPRALCGEQVVWGPMELAPGPRCGTCLALVRSAAAEALVLSRHSMPAEHSRLRSVASMLRDVLPFHSNEWIKGKNRRVRPRTAPDSRATSPTEVAHQSDRPEPPAGMYRPVVPVGETVGGETAARAPVSSPAQIVSDTVTVTGGRPLAAQPSLPQRPGPDAAGAGLGGLQPAEDFPPDSSRRVPLAGDGGVCAGQRHTPLPAAALSAVSPDGRDGQQDARRKPRPRRCVLLAHPDYSARVELATPAAGMSGVVGRDRSERPARPAPTTPTVPAQR